MKEQLLTQEERDFFHREGYLVIRNALTPNQLSTLNSAIAQQVGADTNQPHNQADILGTQDEFLRLVNLNTVFPKVWDLLGWNIWVNHSHYNVNPPEKRIYDEPIYYGWHRDGGAIYGDMGAMPPLMSIKVGFYLTDLTQPEKGQTFIIPGSHCAELDKINMGPMDEPPDDAKPLHLSAGSAVLYHQRTIHSIHSPNYSTATRKAIFIQWAYRWLYPVDPMTVEHINHKVTDPVVRQLLGFTTVDGYYRRDEKLVFAGQNRSGRYYPTAEDVPLYRHIVEDLGLEPARGRVWKAK